MTPNTDKPDKINIGDWVCYRKGTAEEERGRIKSWNATNVFVVYGWAGEQADWENYTGEATNPDDLTFENDGQPDEPNICKCCGSIHLDPGISELINDHLFELIDNGQPDKPQANQGDDELREIQKQIWEAARVNMGNSLGYRLLDAHFAAISALHHRQLAERLQELLDAQDQELDIDGRPLGRPYYIFSGDSERYYLEEAIKGLTP